KEAAVIRYGLSDDAWNNYYEYLYQLILRTDAKCLLDVGAGAHPVLDAGQVARLGLKYALLDISASELQRAPEYCEKILADIQAPDLPVSATYDLILTKMLAEHIEAPQQFHRNIHRLLKPGGRAFHFLPTLFSPPFVANLLVPEALSSKVLPLINTNVGEGKPFRKFPAFYRWCRGPTRGQIRRLEGIGFRVEEFVGFYGAGGYYKWLPPLVKLDRWLSDVLVNHPVPLLTSYAYIVLQKT